MQTYFVYKRKFKHKNRNFRPYIFNKGFRFEPLFGI